MMNDLRDDIETVIKVFPQAYCTSYKDKFCVAWPAGIEPIIAFGPKPKKAWHNAAKLVRGKNKKALEKLIRKLIEEEQERHK